jgi:hypothetical protein
MSFSIGQGDLAPDLVLQLTENGSPKDLTAYTGFTMHWRKPDGSLVAVTLSVLDAATGKVTRSWVAGDTDLAGTHRATVTATRSGGLPQTFPSQGSPAYWIVSAALP